MEEVLSNYPYITNKIFVKLDNVSLSKCRKVSGSWKSVIDKQKEVWIRKIQMNTKFSQASVRNTLQTKNVESLVFLAHQSQKVCSEYHKNQFNESTDLHQQDAVYQTTENDAFQVCQLIFEKNEEKSIHEKLYEIPLHYASNHKHSEMCWSLYEDFRGKNPKYDNR